jgi:hypothetical protein
MPARPTYAFDAEGHTVVVEERDTSSIFERYVCWFLSEGYLWEIPVKAALAVPTICLMITIEMVFGGKK